VREQRWATYSQVRAVAETLVDAGDFVRQRKGTAHQYARATSPEEHLTHQLAELLARSENPSEVLPTDG